MGGEKLLGRRAASHETPRQWGSLLRKEENQQRTRWKKVVLMIPAQRLHCYLLKRPRKLIHMNEGS